MYCPKCNKYIPVNYSKCPNCGYRPAPDSVQKDELDKENRIFDASVSNFESKPVNKKTDEHANRDKSEFTPALHHGRETRKMSFLC